MRETTFLILTALADRPRHGYGIVQEVSVLSGGRVALLPGTLYTALDRLTAQGLVELSGEEVVDGRLRRYYRLCADGRAELARQSERLRRLASAADSRLKTLRPDPA
ncbi:PadR family transcriptional regulator [Actinoplanes sichuanensis]|uniref:PadR family transcriptional regulator n=1 Tax=Actinoplanes sichuanensis TaxID=512349 RepID=A0ABW4A901_9ACTN|nr:helix-turn-helix transcriptional regulator [Actinoplanes sichuanensis]